MTKQWNRSPLPDLNCSPVVGEIKQLLHELAKNAKLELMRGNDQAVKELLEVFLESGDECSKVEKKNVANGERKSPEPPNCKGLPFVKGVTL